jgi:hypothetical protein
MIFFYNFFLQFFDDFFVRIFLMICFSNQNSHCVEWKQETVSELDSLASYTLQIKTVEIRTQQKTVVCERCNCLLCFILLGQVHILLLVD